jgi:hypothetical protein
MPPTNRQVLDHPSLKVFVISIYSYEIVETLVDKQLNILLKKITVVIIFFSKGKWIGRRVTSSGATYPQSEL